MKTTWKLALGIAAGLALPTVAFAADFASSGGFCGLCPF